MGFFYRCSEHIKFKNGDPISHGDSEILRVKSIIWDHKNLIFNNDVLKISRNHENLITSIGGYDKSVFFISDTFDLFKYEKR